MTVRRVRSSRASGLAALAGLLVAVGVTSSAAGRPRALPPHGGAVVFASDIGIYVANVDGTASTRLATGYASGPVWSPDAKRIAFSRLDKSGFPVLVMNRDGHGMRRVGDGDHPAWSPNGKRIAFEGDGITVVNPDGTGARTVAESAALGFSWSPDGRRIAYSDGEEPARIHVVDVTSGASTTLGTSSFERAWRFAWSPDGTTIAFDGDGLELVDVATGQVNKLTDQLGTFTPVWAPDSTRIAFIADDKLFTIGRDGRGKRRVADVGHLLGGGAAASWSADGSLLVYERERFAGSFETDIWRVKADGTGAKPITRAFPTGAGYSSPDWAATTISPRPSKPAPAISLRPDQILRTAEPVVELSADGSRAAVATEDGYGGCGPVAIWSATGSATWLPGGSRCGDGSMSEFVLAGTHAAWTIETDTNTIHETGLETGSPETQASRLTSADHDEGDFLGNLAGDGPLLVYNTWRGFRTEGGRVRGPRLWRIVGKRAAPRLVLAAPNAVAVVSVDASRIAVLRPDGTLVLLNEKGKRLSAFRLGRQRGTCAALLLVRPCEAITLSGSMLVVLRGKTVEVRDATTGTLKHRWPAASSSGDIELEDAHGNFAVYTAGIAIHLLRLSDGRDRVLAIAKQAGPAHAELEPDGLYYSYNETGSTKPGRVAFVPLTQLTARFR